MKAIVMETRGNEAAILLKDGTFRTVKGRYSVGETIDYRDPVRPAIRRWIAAAAAVILIMTGGGFWYDANYVVYAEISLDVNPSVAYTVNRQSLVLEVRAVNEDAGGTVSALEEEGVRFMPVAEAIDRTMTLFENEGYLDAENDDYVLINISTDITSLYEKVVSEVESGLKLAMKRDPTMEYRVDHSDRDTAKRASDNNMSTGRYAVWEQEGGGREMSEYAEMPVREIMEKPNGTAPSNNAAGSAPQREEDTPPVHADDVQGPGTPDISDQQPSASTDGRNGPDGSVEPDGSGSPGGSGNPGGSDGINGSDGSGSPGGSGTPDNSGTPDGSGSPDGSDARSGRQGTNETQDMGPNVPEQ